MDMAYAYLLQPEIQKSTAHFVDHIYEPNHPRGRNGENEHQTFEDLITGYWYHYILLLHHG
jgi:hypothetical protein